MRLRKTNSKRRRIKGYKIGRECSEGRRESEPKVFERRKQNNNRNRGSTRREEGGERNNNKFMGLDEGEENQSQRFSKEENKIITETGVHH
jgi:hypothetical protein